MAKKAEILFRWTEPWQYAWFKCKRDLSSLFTLKKPHGILISLAPLLLLMAVAFIAIYRVINDINVFVPAPPGLSESMTNAPLLTILCVGFGGFVGCLIAIVPLTLICALLERNITFYENKFKLGRRVIKYKDIHSFAIIVSDGCHTEISVLKLGTSIDLGVAPDIDTEELHQTLLRIIPEKK